MQTDWGVRTTIDYLITNGTNTTCNWEITMPAGVAAFLGKRVPAWLDRPDNG